ncbi:hypothetical protein [Azospirillum largimobile]
MGQQRHEQGGTGGFTLGILRCCQCALEIISVESVAIKADQSGSGAAGSVRGQTSTSCGIGERLIETAKGPFCGEQGRQNGDKRHGNSEKRRQV